MCDLRENNSEATEVQKAWKKWRGLWDAYRSMEQLIESDEEFDQFASWVDQARDSLISKKRETPDDWAYQFDALLIDPHSFGHAFELYQQIQEIIGAKPAAILDGGFAGDDWTTSDSQFDFRAAPN